MDTVQKAKAVLAEAGTKLRQLIDEALDQHRYDDVKEVAELAAQLSKLQLDDKHYPPNPGAASHPPRAKNSPPVSRAKAPEKVATTTTSKTKPKDKKRPKQVSGYPKFVREESRLIKIGWSKKRAEEYEHRVPSEAVLTIVRHLRENIEEAKVFEIEALLPVSDKDGNEIPGYQVYVVFAWLRSAGVIEKKGRDGYIVRKLALLDGEFNGIWNGLQSRPV